MKWIDEKGKLFGKLNIIDALVLLIVILAVVLVGVKVWNNHQEQLRLEQEQAQADVDEEEYWVIYKVKITAVDPISYEAITRFVDKENNKIDQMFTAAGLQDGYVVNVEATPHVTYVECEDGTVKRVESSGEDERLDLLFTCVANVQNFETNMFNVQEIRIGVYHILKTVHFAFPSGVVVYVDWKENRNELAEVVDLDVLNAVREEFLNEDEGE